MTKSDLIQAVRDREPWLRESDARSLVDLFFGRDSIIAQELADGRDVVITGFGTFGTRTHSERVMPNPHGGEPLDVQSGRAPTFRAGAALRRRVQLPVRLHPVHR